MFEVVFLGTAASAPSIQRGLSAQVVIYKDYRFLVDCGEGTQRQILKSGIGFRRLDRILLTHGHLDHILGLGGLISTFARWEATEGIEIWGGKWTLDRVEELIFGVVLRGAKPPVDIELFEIKPGVLMEDEAFQLVAFPVDHRGPDCYGFSFQEKARRPFLEEKAEALNVPRGPERRKLVMGEAVKLEDGRVVQPDEVLGEEISGIKVAITGDVGGAARLLDPVRGADLLISEATYIHEEIKIARRHGHITAREAAELARDAGVRDLLLTHLSRRYRERDILNEARAIFPGAMIAHDFDHYRIRRDQALERVTSQ